MDHKLRVLVRLDIDCTAAVLAVSGCLTNDNYPSLSPLVVRTLALVDGLCVVIDLRDAMHIDLPAVDMLARMVADFPTAAPHMPVVILRPDVMPECPVPIALEGLPPLTASCASG